MRVISAWKFRLSQPPRAFLHFEGFLQGAIAEMQAEFPNRDFVILFQMIPELRKGSAEIRPVFLLLQFVGEVVDHVPERKLEPRQCGEVFLGRLLHVDDPRRHRVGGHLADDVQLVKALGRDEVQILMVLDRCTQEFLLQLRRKFLNFRVAMTLDSPGGLFSS